MGDATHGVGAGTVPGSSLPDEEWVTLLGADPRPWLLQSEEPPAVWACLTRLLDVPEDEPAAAAARREVLADTATHALMDSLPAWGSPDGFPGHDSPRFAPNMLLLLADMGVRPGDDVRVDRLLDAVLAHQDPDGRFASCGGLRSREPAWGSLLCDTHAICEVAVRYGRGDDPRVRRAVESMASDLVQTNQGRGWLCRPETTTGFRGPGRKADLCPQVSLQALRVLAVQPGPVPRGDLAEACRTVLAVWRGRGERQPYMFGHGVRFKEVKWPHFWYDVLAVLDTLGRYPEVWTGHSAAAEDTQSAAELLACLAAYDFDADGRVVPKRAYRGFEGYSFGQKKRPSPFATAIAASTMRRLEPVSRAARGVDVSRLGSSKGGTGSPIAPRSPGTR